MPFPSSLRVVPPLPRIDLCPEKTGKSSHPPLAVSGRLSSPGGRKDGAPPLRPIESRTGFTQSAGLPASPPFRLLEIQHQFVDSVHRRECAVGDFDSRLLRRLQVSVHARGVRRHEISRFRVSPQKNIPRMRFDGSTELTQSFQILFLAAESYYFLTSSVVTLHRPLVRYVRYLKYFI